MKTTFIEAVSEAGNWGKFAVCAFDHEEWSRPSVVNESEGYRAPLLHGVGWSTSHVLVLDLQTGEGAIMFPGGHAKNDLDKHRVWVCPLFLPFLEWLWADWNERAPGHVDTWLDELPHEVRLTGVPLQLAGYRRPGPEQP